ncbi:alcohol dehydrogenase [Acrasis kona]|uniref:Alcohol dehydrogenase n=1 Tax=Acrasis kona TaxID=1008807 RepID=A0AAW2YLL8_9EUKA
MYKVAQVSSPGSPFEIVERSIPEPGNGEVLIKVEACGLCHSDQVAVMGFMPVQYPIVPGHEVVGRIHKLGPGVNGKFWEVGERIGVGWHAGHCFNCKRCRRGDFNTCHNEKICGVSIDGGYGEYMIAPWEALAKVPNGLTSEEAAPLMCAGVTVYNGMRNTDTRPGDVCAVIGIGGLGHLAVQYAVKMGFKVIAVSGGAEKKDLSLNKLGAHYYIDYKTQDVVKEINQLGGAKLIVSTAPGGEDTISKLTQALAVNGRLLLLGVSGDLKLNPMELIVKRASVSGFPAGNAMDSEETMEFTDLVKVNTIVETFRLEQVAEAYEKMMANKVRFRAVLVFDK